MENYKVKVGSEAESKEVQELFFELGAEWKYRNIGRNFYYDNSVGFLYTDNGCITVGEKDTGLSYFNQQGNKEITLPQLRDLVVLKRNDYLDGNYTFEDADNQTTWIVYKGFDKTFIWKDFKWKEWFINAAFLKPKTNIKGKSMKEYLNKLTDGTYKLVVLGGDVDGVEGLIEVPEGANFYCDKYFWKQLNSRKFWNGKNWQDNEKTLCNFSKSFDSPIVWQRETLNDKVASAEVARQEFIGVPFSDLPEFNFEAADVVDAEFFPDERHPHYKKDISHLDTLDIYRVTELFNPHACGAHIAKKALCSGQRGHKDSLTDIQDIIDTAERWKEMLIEDEKAK